MGLSGMRLADEIVDVMQDPERRQNLLDRLDNFITPQPILSYDDVIRMDPADRDRYISTVLAQHPLLDEDSVSGMTLRSLLFGYALPKSYNAVSGAARGAMAARKPIPALPGNSQPGQLPAPAGTPPLALPAPTPQGSVIPLPSRFPSQGIPPVPSNIDLESIIQALVRDWGHRGGAQF